MILPNEIKWSNRKTISLKIDRNGKFIALAPFFTEEKTILNFVEKKQPWIEKSMGKVISSNDKYSITDVNDGNKTFLFGKEYKIKIGEYKRGGIIDGFFVIPMKYADNIQIYLKKWYVQKANLYLSKRINDLSEFIEEKDVTLSVSSARTKWGSCSLKRNISLNYRLLMCPEKVIDYIIIHELCHLEYMNHGKKYWEKVALFCPNYKEYDKWLKNNAGILNAT